MELTLPSTQCRDRVVVEHSSVERDESCTHLLIAEVKNELSCNSIPPHTHTFMWFIESTINLFISDQVVEK